MAYPGRAQAVFSRGGVVEALGTDKEILARCDTKTVVLDMKGRYVLPGFTDTHIHLIAAGRSLETLDLSGARSIDELVSSAKKFLSENPVPQNGWFYARGWNQNNMDENRFPDRGDLDGISTELPLFFERSCGHIAAQQLQSMLERPGPAVPVIALLAVPVIGAVVGRPAIPGITTAAVGRPAIPALPAVAPALRPGGDGQDRPPEGQGHGLRGRRPEEAAIHEGPEELGLECQGSLDREPAQPAPGLRRAVLLQGQHPPGGNDTGIGEPGAQIGCGHDLQTVGVDGRVGLGR